MLDYGRIIRRAWQVTWRNKVLWVFGIAAALFGGTSRGGGGGSPGGVQYLLSGSDIERWRHMGPGLPFGPRGAYVDWQAVMAMIMGVIAVLLVVGLVLFVVGLIVRYTSQGALIGMVDEVERTECTTFKAGVRRGWSRLLYLLAIDILIAIAMFAAVMALVMVLGVLALVLLGPGIALVSAREGLVAPGVLLLIGGGLALVLVIVVVAVALSALSTIVRAYAYRGAVLDQQGVFEALKAAIARLRARPRESLLMWLLLLAIDVGLGVVMIPLGLIGAGALIGPAAATYAMTNEVWAAVLVALPILAVVGLVALFIGGVYLTFRSAVWTLTYRELAAQ
ncbi:MAG: hypothetical protein V1772_05065 [Chloroflexota bacterium]